MTHDMKLERVIDASPAEVFDAFTDPETLRRWYGPADGWAVSVRSDVRVGGTTSVEFGSEGAYREEHTYREVDRPRRLAYEQTAVEPGREPVRTSLVLTFENEEGKTRLSITEKGYPTAERRDSHHAGWLRFIGTLEGVIGPKAS